MVEGGRPLGIEKHPLDLNDGDFLGEKALSRLDLNLLQGGVAGDRGNQETGGSAQATGREHQQQRGDGKNEFHRLTILPVAYRVSKSKFAELVQRALEELPEEFEEFLEEVPVDVRQKPDAGHKAAVKLAPGALLLGLYRGRPRTQRSVEDSGAMPDVIYIFQDSIEQVCHSEEELVRQVRTTVLHEIGHHFGLDEDDLSRLGYG